jgi:hypothetical protein
MSAQQKTATSALIEDIKGYPKIRLLHGSGKASAEVADICLTQQRLAVSHRQALRSLLCSLCLQVYLNGATLSSWKVQEQELIFVRST